MKLSPAASLLIALGVLTTVSATEQSRGGAHKSPVTPPASPPAQVDKTDAADTYAWLTRTLVKEPAYKSEKVRYTTWVLGDGRKSVMTMVWDESGGTGKGYDTFYFDTNLNGDLTEPGKCFHGPNFEVKGIKETDGPRKFDIKVVFVGDNFDWQSNFSMSGPGMGYQVALLPGNLKIQWSNALKNAPVYHIGGPAVLHCCGKNPGESLGRWKAGTTAEVSTDVNLMGDPQCLLRFYHSTVPGGEPQIVLRVTDKSGKTIEDIPFTGGCGCAGSFGKSLLIPSRVAPGSYNLAVKLERAAYLGGPAEFLFPVEIDNPDYGKALADPAFLALKAQFPSARITSMRRSATVGQDIKGFPDENVVAAQVADNSLYGPTRDWDMSPVNQGGETMLGLGKQVWHNVDARTLIKFDLSALGRNVNVAGAQLRLTLSNQPSTGAKPGDKISAYALKQDWRETEGSCWNGPKTGAHWGAPGCDDTGKDRSAESAGSVDLSGFPAANEHYRFVAIDLTALVRKWQSGELPNNGVILKYSGAGCVKACSSEFQDYPFRPTLVLALDGPGVKAASAAVAIEDDLESARASARRSNSPLLVKVYSPTCAVCKSVQETTFSDSAVKEMLARKFQYVNVKIDDYAKLAQDWGVGSVPAVVLLKSDGVTKIGVIGSDKLKDKAQFLAALADPAKAAAESGSGAASGCSLRATEEWSGKLRDRTLAALKAGKHLNASLMLLNSRPQNVKILGADERELQVEQDGSKLSWAWSKLKQDDCRSLAEALVKTGDDDSHLLVGVFLQCTGQPDKAEGEFSKAIVSNPRFTKDDVSKIKEALARP